MNMKWYTDQLSDLAGYTIKDACTTPEPHVFGESFFGLVLTKGSKTKILWFLADDEGNGPGSFEIQDEENGGE